MDEEQKERKKAYQDVYNKEYYEKNKEKMLQKSKDYGIENKDKVKEHQRIYREKNQSLIQLKRKEKFDVIAITLKKEEKIKETLKKFADEQGLTMTQLCEIAIDEYIKNKRGNDDE